MGGYSSAFDLVSSEYGWTDDVINNLTIRRLRQITTAIQRRKYLEGREERAIASWQTRILAQYIAAGYMVKGENKALNHAAEIAFDEIEEEQLMESKLAASEEVSQKEPEVGSYERFMNSFGNRSAWRG